MKSKIQLLLAAFAIAFFAGCASTKVSMDGEYQGFLPRPSRVLVYNFAVSPDEVEMDSGISADIQELVNKRPLTDQERTIGRQLSAALATHLVKEIGVLGIPAIHASTNVPVAGRALAIKGQFISVDEGNQAERVVIGCGLGRTDVRTLVEAYEFNEGKKAATSPAWRKPWASVRWPVMWPRRPWSARVWPWAAKSSRPTWTQMPIARPRPSPGSSKMFTLDKAGCSRDQCNKAG
jgi:hypothetical protein